MKKVLFAVISLITLTFGTSFEAQAQIEAGAALAIGTEVNNSIGLRLFGRYTLDDPFNMGADLGLTPDITIFFPGENINWWEINLNGQLLFSVADNIEVFPLAGLNITTVGVDLGSFGSANNTEVGLNLGGGGQIGIADNIKLVADLKYVISSVDQLVIAVGGAFSF